MKGLKRRLLSFLLALSLVLLTLSTLPVLATTRYEETSPSITYTGTWGTYTNAGASGGTQKYSTQAGATAEFSFSSTKVRWIIAKNNNYGIAKVYIDGVYDKDVDLYSPTQLWQQVVYTKAGLSLGSHKIKIEVTGTNNPSSANKYIGVDAFETDFPVGAPTGVKVTAPSEGGKLIISWDPITDPDFDHIRIWRSDSRYQPPEGPAKDGVTGSSYTDENLAGGVKYSYQLEVVDKNGIVSSKSAAVSATPFAPSPGSGGVRVENEGSGGKLVISWANPPTGTYDYVRVYRSSVAGSLGVPVTMERIDGTSVVDGGLTDGSTYYYTVRCVDFAGSESFNADQHSGVPSVSQTRYEEMSSQVAFSGIWKDMAASHYSAGTSKVSNAIRAAAEFSFTSSSVAWIGAKAPNGGIARVLIDGVQQSTVDLYSTSSVYQQKVFTKSGLTNTAHTLRIEVTGLKNPASSDTYVDVDAFDFDVTPTAGILPTPSPATTQVAGAAVGNGEIVGRVVNRAGQTVPGTAVRVNATVVPTNPGGEFRFTLVAAGVYAVYYDAPGYRGQTQVIQVGAGQSTRCPTVIMDPGITPSTQGEIFGRVVNPAHQPLAWAAVRINNIVVPTNGNGEFRFQLVNPGVYTVYYDAAGYAGQTQMLEVKAGMVTYPPMVILSGTLGEIYGRVLDARTRRATPGTAVRVNSSVMPTNPGGEFRFTLVHPGTYKVYYDAPGYKGQIQEAIAVFAGTTTICPTVLMSR